LAQSTAPANLLPQITPPSPTAAALGKYTEIPVSPYTGVPNISIPLYEIKVRDITVPISLSYHAGGNRVEEEASWVGLGWSLNAGGVLGRSVRGKDDLIYYPMTPSSSTPMPDFYYPGYSESCQGFTAGGKPVNYCSGAPSDQTDWEPDAFFFNFLSTSGKFVLDQQGVPQLLEQAKIKIDLPAPGRPGFQVRTADGFRYDFFDGESTLGSTGNVSDNYATSWYLTKIVSPTGEVVTFTYAHSATTVNSLSSFSEVLNLETTGGCTPNYVDGRSLSASMVSTIYLSRIDFK